MGEMVERVARAIQAELRRQGVLYEDGEDLNRLMLGTGEAADLTAVCRAAIAAMREPTEAMIEAHPEEGVSWNAEARGYVADGYRAMIDAALSR